MCVHVHELDKTDRSRFTDVVIRRATCLVGGILYLSNRLLPTSVCAIYQSLPALVNNSIRFHLDLGLRSLYRMIVSNLEQFSTENRMGGRDIIKLDPFWEMKKKLDLELHEAVVRQYINDSVGTMMLWMKQELTILSSVASIVHQRIRTVGVGNHSGIGGGSSLSSNLL